MKRVILFMFLSALLSLSACAQTNEKKGREAMSKTLVAYFSASGNTERVAKALSEVIDGADLYEIKPEKRYSREDLDWTDQQSRSSVEMKDLSYRPAMVKDLRNVEQYDVVYIGFPIWWYTAPTIVNTFVESYSLKGKKVVLFATSGGSTPAKALDDMKKTYPDLDFVDAKLVNHPNKDELKRWTDGLK